MKTNPIGVILVRLKKHGWSLLMAELEYDDSGAVAWAIPLHKISPVGPPAKMVEVFKGDELKRMELQKARKCH